LNLHYFTAIEQAALFCIFTVDIDGKPVTVLNAPSAGYARGICEVPEFRSDLTNLTSSGMPICTDASRITVRSANDAEIAAFKFATRRSPASDATVFVLLIAVDCLTSDVILAQE
jgi:hypothetical protein